MLGSRGEALGLGTGVLGAHSEGVVAHGLDHVSEEDLRGERVAVIDDGLPSWPLPAVQLHTTASLGKGPADRPMGGRGVMWEPQSRAMDGLSQVAAPRSGSPQQPRAGLPDVFTPIIPRCGT